jgi:hypothetical protein
MVIPGIFHLVVDVGMRIDPHHTQIIAVGVEETRDLDKN